MCLLLTGEKTIEELLSERKVFGELLSEKKIIGELLSEKKVGSFRIGCACSYKQDQVFFNIQSLSRSGEMTPRNIISMQPQFDELEPDQGPVQFSFVPTCQQLVNVNMGPAAGFYNPCLAPGPSSCRYIPGYVYPAYVNQTYQLPGTPWDYVNAMPSLVNSGAYPYYPQPMVPAHPPPAQMQAPYPHPMNNPHGAVLGHPSNSQFRIPSFQPPPQHPLHAGFNRRRVRVVQSENNAFLDMSRVNEMENAADELRDMRLDIDGMSYEELLDLEARIGDVKTGLSKDFILNNLRTHLHKVGVSSDSDASWNDTCIICQGGYDAKDCIGTLDCGHMYHSDCIKEWLVLKNVCPICKKVALSTDRRDG
ncbi:putative E3 ubiquitin-protein ligase ZFP1 isoform X2 [Carex rostrata]